MSLSRYMAVAIIWAAAAGIAWAVPKPDLVAALLCASSFSTIAVMVFGAISDNRMEKGE